MSRASELADWCDEHSSGDYRTSAEAATELRRLTVESEMRRALAEDAMQENHRLERVNAELVEALELFRKTLKAKAVCYWSDPETEADLKALAALTSATKETK